MMTDNSIKRLRSKLAMNQKQFAEAIAVSHRTLFGYEKGNEPKVIVLERLRDLAIRAGIQDLVELFEAKRRSEIISKVEKLPSQGAQRRIDVPSLQRWRDQSALNSKALHNILDEGQLSNESAARVRECIDTLNRIQVEIEFRIKPANND